MAQPIKSIKDLCSFSNGHGFTRHDWAKTGLPIIRIAHLNGSRKFDYYSSEPDPDWVVEPGELLFAWAGTKGVSFGPTIWNGPRGVLNQHIFRVRPKNGVDQTWLYYALLQATRQIERRAHGFKSTLLHVRKSDIEDQRWPVPPIADQRRIVELLSLAAGEDRCLSDLIQAKGTYKRGLMQQLLAGQRRFPEFRDRPWAFHRFDALCEELSDRNGNQIGADHVMGVIKGVGLVRMRERVRGKADLARYKIVPPGAFAYNPMRLNIGSVAFNDSGRSVLVSPDYVVFRARTGISSPEFINQLRYSSYWTTFMKRAGAGSVRVRIYFSDLGRLRVPAPALDEQVRIAGVLRLVDAEVAQLAKLHELGEGQKAALLSRLLNGEPLARAR